MFKVRTNNRFGRKYKIAKVDKNKQDLLSKKAKEPSHPAARDSKRVKKEFLNTNPCRAFAASCSDKVIKNSKGSSRWK